VFGQTEKLNGVSGPSLMRMSLEEKSQRTTYLDKAKGKEY
jgi:hypothetical protein